MATLIESGKIADIDFSEYPDGPLDPSEWRIDGDGTVEVVSGRLRYTPAELGDVARVAYIGAEPHNGICTMARIQRFGGNGWTQPGAMARYTADPLMSVVAAHVRHGTFTSFIIPAAYQTVEGVTTLMSSSGTASDGLRWAKIESVDGWVSVLFEGFSPAGYVVQLNAAHSALNGVVGYGGLEFRAVNGTGYAECASLRIAKANVIRVINLPAGWKISYRRNIRFDQAFSTPVVETDGVAEVRAVDAIFPTDLRILNEANVVQDTVQAWGGDLYSESGRPYAPTVEVTDVTRTGFKILASGLDPEGDPILYRQLQVSTAGHNLSAFVASIESDTGEESEPQDEYVIAGLTPNTTRYFRARDNDGAGWGPWSAIQSVKTQQSSPPSAPDVSVDGITRASAQISASAYTEANGDPWVETEVRVVRVDNGAVVFGPVTLTERAFPVLATGLPPATELRAQVRDADSIDGYGAVGVATFTTEANQAPTAPVITSPGPGFVDLLELLALRAETATDPEGDAITYRWRYAVKDSEDWTDIPGAVDLEAPAFDWNALPFLNTGVLYDIQCAAVDAFGATTWSESVTIRAGAGTETLYTDFAEYAPNEELDWTNRILTTAATLGDPGPAKAFYVRGFPGTHGNRAAELYNGHGIAYQHLRTYITLWEEAGELTRPCAVLGFRLRHGNVATDTNARPFAGVALACDLEPITTSGYGVFVGATGISGHARESDGSGRGLKAVASSGGFLKPDYPYRLEVRLAGQAVVTSTTVKKSYIDYVAGIGPYQGIFSRVQVPVGVIVAEVYDDLTDELVMSATLHHRREPSHDEDFYVLGGSHIPIEGYCGLAIGDYSGSMIADYVAFRELDLPDLPPERTERYARWRAPFFGANAPYELAPAWEPVVDPQERTILYRLDRVDMEADEPAYEEILAAQEVAPIGGLCTLPPIDMTEWRQSRGWRLALQHSLDGGETWSERILTPRFLVDRSEGTASTGFTEYQPGVNPDGWIALWGNPVYYPTEVAGSTDGRSLIHKNKDGIFGMYVGNGFGWYSAGQRRQVAVWATQRCNSLQASVGVVARAVAGSTPFAYYLSLNFGYTGDHVQIGLRGKNATAHAEGTLLLSNDYHMVLEAETLENNTVELRGYVWRAELEDRPAEPTVTRVIDRPAYINEWGMAGIMSGNYPIHGAGGGSRLRECDEFCVTGLEPLPDDRPEVGDEPNPAFQPNEAPPIEEFCPECPTDTPPTIVVEAATRSARPTNWFDTDVDDITVPEI